MIRFIDLQHNAYDLGFENDIAFAFFDTVTDTFVDFGGEQVFEARGDFARRSHGHPFRERCLAKIPDWVSEESFD